MRKLIILIMAVMLVSLTSCGDFKEITVNSVAVHNVSLDGLKAVDIELFVEIDNPASRLTLSDMEATVKHSGKVLGKVTVDPFTLERKKVQVYDLKARMALQLKVHELYLLMDPEVITSSVVDITVKGTIRGGISKTITKNDVPLKKLISYANEK